MMATSWPAASGGVLMLDLGSRRFKPNISTQVGEL